MEDAVEKDVDMQTLSATIAGFLACHVLTCRFLVQEGIVDEYLEGALSEMTPDIHDARSLFGLQQLIKALRAPETEKLQ